jgi:diguanylate cyclase
MEPRGRVLIVDDNKINVDVLCHLLHKDYDVGTAFSGSDCLAQLPTFAPQVVLLDIMMPGMDGYEVCRRIKSSAMGDSVRVLLVSGKGMPADRVQGYEAQADDYIVKPFDHKELLSKVRVHFRQFQAGEGVRQSDTREAMDRLLSLIKQMSADIGEHVRVVGRVQQELDALENPDHDVILEALLRLADNNRLTQEQLSVAERKLRDQAHSIETHATEARTDALTGLPNRRAFDEELRRRIASADQLGTRLWAIMLDVDHFKDLNDRWGHPAGDAALKAVGGQLAQLDSTTAVAARYGGDEFAALIPAGDVAEVIAAVERLREAVEHGEIRFADQVLHATVSIGCAMRLWNEDGAALIHRADAAMYAAKRAGKNRACWNDGTVSHPITGTPRPASRTTTWQPQGGPLVRPMEKSDPGSPPSPSRVLKNYL